MGGGACWAAVHGVAKGQTRLSDFTFPLHFHALEKETAAHSSVLAWRIPGTGAWWAAVYGVAQSRTRLTLVGGERMQEGRQGKAESGVLPESSTGTRQTAQNTQQGQHACTREEPLVVSQLCWEEAFTAQHFCLPHKRPCACCWSEIDKTLRVVGACHWQPEKQAW